MNKDEALKLLCGGADGIQEWNERRADREKIPILKNISLRRKKLRHANLHRLELDGSHFHAANLHGADLHRASLRGTRFYGADLSDADAWGVDLRDSDLRQATLLGAKLIDANLERCDLRGAVLDYANLSGARLGGAKLEGAQFGSTVIACDLADAQLTDTQHQFPSYIAVGAIRSIRGPLPEPFLRGCGLSDDDIKYFKSKIGAKPKHHSCFISYCTADEQFATKLHNDLQQSGVRCWKWDHDARTGRELWSEISDAIRKHDKLVLLASQSSLKSPAVNREIERAIREEDDRRQKATELGTTAPIDVLFPIRLDEFIFKGWEHPRKVDVTAKVIADASGWVDDEDKYKNLFVKLLRDLET